jgi:hypothetical protein
MPKMSRKRAITACESCHRHRIGCDAGASGVLSLKSIGTRLEKKIRVCLVDLLDCLDSSYSG